MWIRANGAFEPVVPFELFARAQEIIRERSRRYSNDELLTQLRTLLEREGNLSGLLIDETDGMASSSIYRHRFGSLIQAYKLIEYTPDRDYQFIETNRELRRMYPDLVADAVSNIRRLGGLVVSDSRTDLLRINEEFTASVVLARSRQKPNGCLRWLIRLDAGLKPDITVAVRMDVENRKPLDYYLLPSIDIVFRELTLSEDNPISLEIFRFDTLDYFWGMARRVHISEAA